jgi:hypothetical protein
MGALSSSRLVIEAKDAGNKVVKDSAEQIYGQGGGEVGLRRAAREGGSWRRTTTHCVGG